MNRVGGQLTFKFHDSGALRRSKRYFNFRIATTSVAQQDIHINDVAGNSSVILVTAWEKSGEATPRRAWRLLFAQPLTMPPKRERVALLLSVADLGAAYGFDRRARL